MNAGVGEYRAKSDCRAGGFFRKAGEVFEMPRLEKIPAHLEEAGAQAFPGGGKPASAPKGGKPAPVPKDVQAGKDDIGAGKVTPVQEVTSADMVTK